MIDQHTLFLGDFYIHVNNKSCPLAHKIMYCIITLFPRILILQRKIADHKANFVKPIDNIVNEKPSLILLQQVMI